VSETGLPFCAMNQENSWTNDKKLKFFYEIPYSWTEEQYYVLFV
jgi:hypothetical protein